MPYNCTACGGNVHSLDHVNNHCALIRCANCNRIDTFVKDDFPVMCPRHKTFMIKIENDGIQCPQCMAEEISMLRDSMKNSRESVSGISLE